MTPANASTSSTRRCATARRRRASTSRSRTSCHIAGAARRARHRLCRGRLSRRQPARHRASSSSAHDTRPRFTAFGMTKRAGRSAANDPGLAALLEARARRDLLRRQGLGLPRPRRARLHARGEPRGHPRQRRASPAQPGREAHGRLRALLRRLQGQPRLCARLRPDRLRGRARAGSCCATPTAARCRTRSSASSARSPRPMPGRSASASTPMTTPSRPSPTRWPPCGPARARSRARSTASASAAATPTS